MFFAEYDINMVEDTSVISSQTLGGWGHIGVEDL